MNIVILGVVFATAGVLIGFGNDMRSTATSRYLEYFGGFVWVGGVVYAFISGGVLFGFLALLASFFIAGITRPIGGAIENNLRKRR